MSLLALLRQPTTNGRGYVPFVENAYYAGMATHIRVRSPRGSRKVGLA